ncbi:MAG: hypothetical protein RL145_1082 [Pseudomonadota bacterium]
MAVEEETTRAKTEANVNGEYPAAPTLSRDALYYKAI